MIFENFIKDSLKPVEGLLTKQRFLLFTLSFLSLTPEAFPLTSLLLTNPSISELGENLKTVVTSAPALPTLGLAVVNFYIAPLLFQTISKLSNRQQITKQSDAVNQLTSIETRDSIYFIEKEIEINTTWYKDMLDARKRVKQRVGFCELLISLTFLSTSLTLQYNCSLIPCLLLIYICIIHCIGESRKNLSDYLANIAIYKIGAHRLSNIKKPVQLQ